jgi:putative transposase
MPCPHCCSAKTMERSDRTAHGYRRFRCRGCGRGFNERTGSVLNRLQLPTDVVFLIVLWRLRMKLSLRDLAEILLLRGLVFSHEAIRDWEARLAPLLTDALRRRRKGKAGRSWYVDETYIKVAGQWQYLYRAIDRDGNLVDVYLSETRDQEAAEALFRSAVAVTGTTPDKVTTDQHASYPPALDEVFCDDVEHRTSKYLNNHLEQDHRGVKGRLRPMRGFQTHTSAARFCLAHDEVRDFFRPATRRKEHVPAARRRAIYVQRVAALRDRLAVA